MTEMTTGEYKRLRGLKSTAGITKAMNGKRRLVGVISYRKVGRDWLLMVDKEGAKKNIRKGSVIQE